MNPVLYWITACILGQSCYCDSGFLLTELHRGDHTKKPPSAEHVEVNRLTEWLADILIQHCFCHINSHCVTKASCLRCETELMESLWTQAVTYHQMLNFRKLLCSCDVGEFDDFSCVPQS